MQGGWWEVAASPLECETLALQTEEMPGPLPPASSQLFLAEFGGAPNCCCCCGNGGKSAADPPPAGKRRVPKAGLLLLKVSSFPTPCPSPGKVLLTERVRAAPHKW